MRRTTLGRKLNRPRGYVFGATWMGLPRQFVTARVVKATVADSTDEKYWARDLIGTERTVIEIWIKVPETKDSKAINEVFYLDNDDGKTVEKLTKGHGDPLLGHKQVVVRDVRYDDPTIKTVYGFTTP